MRGFLRFLGGLWIVAGVVLGALSILCAIDVLIGGPGVVRIPYRGTFGALSFGMMATVTLTVGALLRRAGEAPRILRRVRSRA